MIIKLSGRKRLCASFAQKEGCFINLSDPYEEINFRKEVRSFLKNEGIPFILRVLKSEEVVKNDFFLILTRKPLRSIHALKLACWLEKIRHKPKGGKSDKVKRSRDK